MRGNGKRFKTLAWPLRSRYTNGPRNVRVFILAWLVTTSSCSSRYLTRQSFAELFDRCAFAFATNFVVLRCHFPTQSSRITRVPRFEPGRGTVPRRHVEGSRWLDVTENCVLLSHSLGLHMCTSYTYTGQQRIKYDKQCQHTTPRYPPCAGREYSAL